MIGTPQYAAEEEEEQVKKRQEEGGEDADSTEEEEEKVDVGRKGEIKQSAGRTNELAILQKL